MTTYSGLYYTGVMVAAGTPPSFAGGTSATAGITGIAPAVNGTAGTGNTTPPALGAQLPAITPGTIDNFYAWTS